MSETGFDIENISLYSKCEQRGFCIYFFIYGNTSYIIYAASLPYFIFHTKGIFRCTEFCI